jgi:hypothetical protein
MMFQRFTSSHNIEIYFLQQLIAKLVPSHLDLKEKEEFVNAKKTIKKMIWISSSCVAIVMYLDKMFNVL